MGLLESHVEMNRATGGGLVVEECVAIARRRIEAQPERWRLQYFGARCVDAGHLGLTCPEVLGGVVSAPVFLYASHFPLVGRFLESRQAHSMRINQILFHFLADILMFMFISLVPALTSARVSRVLLRHLLLRSDSLAGL